jgi:hypothetical protein
MHATAAPDQSLLFEALLVREVVPPCLAEMSPEIAAYLDVTAQK